MQFVIVSGLSGAGKSKAASFMEDLGFYCVDNMPADLIPQFAQLCLATKGRYERVALVTDVRASLTFEGLFKALDSLDQMRLSYTILFVDCDTDVIIKRYKETRRKHPLTRDGSALRDAVERERTLLEPIRNRANAVINTSVLSTAKLRGEIINLVAGDQRDRAMSVSVVSFGFKHGLPMEADLVFDVRFLPNPYYLPELRQKTGLDADVRNYVYSTPTADEFFARLTDFTDWLLPRYEEEGKSVLVVAVGCTGGHHRSVAIAHALAEHYRAKGISVSENHRDLGYN
jgi:UPF0042 nucleotide-binding protein